MNNGGKFSLEYLFVAKFLYRTMFYSGWVIRNYTNHSVDMLPHPELQKSSEQLRLTDVAKLSFSYILINNEVDNDKDLDIICKRARDSPPR